MQGDIDQLVALRVPEKTAAALVLRRVSNSNGFNWKEKKYGNTIELWFSSSMSGTCVGRNHTHLISRGQFTNFFLLTYLTVWALESHHRALIISPTHAHALYLSLFLMCARHGFVVAGLSSTIICNIRRGLAVHL